MELSYEALESAGITLEQVKGSATSVYAAVFPSDYGGHLYRDPLDLPTYYMTGVQQTILANRISHVFDLRGPSFTLDTACSGGLVALHQACQSLRDSESDTAIVGASNLILSPDHFVGLSNLHMLSSTGRCYPFDVSCSHDHRLCAAPASMLLSLFRHLFLHSALRRVSYSGLNFGNRFAVKAMAVERVLWSWLSSA
jgi:acyl transferase domain-containing protein